MLRVAGAETVTEVEGPGRRFALWLQGCFRNCPECCNPHMHDFAAGSLLSEEELAKQIYEAEADGLTIVGGEPLEQPEALNRLFDLLKKNDYNKSIMIFSGFSFDEISSDAKKLGLVKRCDVLVAGPFVKDLAPDNRKWIGSSNQTVHFFGNRLDFLKENWPAHSAEIEIHIADGQISINGFPVGENSDFEKIFAQFRERQI